MRLLTYSLILTYAGQRRKGVERTRGTRTAVRTFFDESLTLVCRWKEHQDQLKSQPLEITYFHWTGDEAKIDPSKYFTVTVRKGTTISSFFEIIKQEIKDLRSISTNDLMFVKEDFVVPQHHTFYDLVLSISKEGKQLFHFDKLDDPRQKELYSIRIVDRKWYERNRHIFPYSKWTVFDPSLQTSTRDTIDPK